MADEELGKHQESLTTEASLRETSEAKVWFPGRALA